MLVKIMPLGSPKYYVLDYIEGPKRDHDFDNHPKELKFSFGLASVIMSSWENDMSVCVCVHTYMYIYVYVYTCGGCR